MIAVFYDRKHNCEVRSSELCSINLMHYPVTFDDDGEAPCQVTPDFHKDRLFTRGVQLGTIGYKSPDCASYKNWDRWLNLDDLVFLKLEEDQPARWDTAGVKEES
jgi:hypothetical protein